MADANPNSAEHPTGMDDRDTGRRADAGSFRDPGNRVFHQDGQVYRALDRRAMENWQRLSATRLFAEGVADGRIVGTELAAGVDTIDGGEGADTIDGGTGDDMLRGDDGNDLIEGGAGADTIDGGLGNDTASYADSDAAVDVDLGTDTASGGHAEGDDLDSIA